MSEIICKETETLSNSSAITSSSTPTPNELKKTVKIQELPSMMNHHITPAGISRERSFVRSSNPQSHQVSFERFKVYFSCLTTFHDHVFKNLNKRRSLGFQQHQQQQIRKPLELYRPPSKGNLILNRCYFPE